MVQEEEEVGAGGRPNEVAAAAAAERKEEEEEEERRRRRRGRRRRKKKESRIFQKFSKFRKWTVFFIILTKVLLSTHLMTSKDILLGFPKRPYF